MHNWKSMLNSGFALCTVSVETSARQAGAVAVGLYARGKPGSQGVQRFPYG